MYENQRDDLRGIRYRKDKSFPKQVTMDAKRHLIMEDIAKGMGYMDLMRKYTEEWGLSKSHIMNVINDTLAFMRDEATKQSLVSMNMARLDTIITEAMSDKDRKNAIRGIDVQNKLAGGYEEKVNVTTDTDINFIFDIGE